MEDRVVVVPSVEELERFDIDIDIIIAVYTTYNTHTREYDGSGVSTKTAPLVGKGVLSIERICEWVRRHIIKLDHAFHILTGHLWACLFFGQQVRLVVV